MACANPGWSYNYTVTYLWTEAGHVTNKGSTGGDDDNGSAQDAHGKCKQGNKYAKNKRQK